MKMLKNRKALSTVVITLIILVVSVLLATVVPFYAVNVTTTRVQEESLQVFKHHRMFCKFPPIFMIYATFSLE